MTTLPIPTATELLEQFTSDQLQHAAACKRERELAAARRQNEPPPAPPDPETVQAFERRDFDGRIAFSLDHYRAHGVDDDIAVKVIFGGLVNEVGFGHSEARTLVEHVTGLTGRKDADNRWAAVAVVMVSEDGIDPRIAVKAVLRLADEQGADLRAIGVTIRGALRRALA